MSLQMMVYGLARQLIILFTVYMIVLNPTTKVLFTHGIVPCI